MMKLQTKVLRANPVEEMTEQGRQRSRPEGELRPRGEGTLHKHRWLGRNVPQTHRGLQEDLIAQATSLGRKAPEN